MKTKYRYNADTVALFAAMCIFLSTVEYMIPKPVPFLRLGLANLPLIIAVAVFKPSDVFVLAVLKAAGQGFINGTILSYVFLFSFSGTLASVSVMLLIKSLGGDRITLTGVSVAGALSSNAVQLLLSGLFVFGASVKYIAPLFLAEGLVTSVLLGITASVFVSESAWLALRKAE